MTTRPADGSHREGRQVIRLGLEQEGKRHVLEATLASMEEADPNLRFGGLRSVREESLPHLPPLHPHPGGGAGGAATRGRARRNIPQEVEARGSGSLLAAHGDISLAGKGERDRDENMP